MRRAMRFTLSLLFLVLIPTLVFGQEWGKNGWHRCGGYGSPGGWCSGNGSFTPSQIAGLKLWLRADSGVTSSLGAVSQWNDLSPSGNNATQSTGANKPTLLSSDIQFGSKPTVNFNGSSSFMSFVHLSPLVAPCTVMFCGLSNNANGTQGDILEDGNSTEFVVSGPTEQYIGYAGTALVSPITSGAPTQVATIFNGASSAIWQNSSSAAAISGPTGAGAVGGASINLGASTVPNNFFQGKIAEIAVYNSSLSKGQIGQWFSYCAQRYAPFTPASLPGIQMWVNASNVTLATAPAVQSMADLSGHGNNITQSTVANQPVLVANAVNGYPAVKFTGSQFMNHPLGSTTSNFTVWAVVSAGQPALGQYQCLYGNNAGVTFATNDGVSTTHWGIYLNAPIFSGSVITSAGNNVFHSTTVVVVSPTGAVTFSTDGNLSTGTGAGAYTANSGTLGGGNSSQPFVGQVAELAVWNRQLATAEIQQLEQYSLSKYNAL